MKHQNPHILVGRSQSSIFVSFSVLGPLLYVLFLNRHLLWTSSEYWGSYLNYYFHVIEEPIRPTTCIIQSGFDICRVMNVLNGSSFMERRGTYVNGFPDDSSFVVANPRKAPTWNLSLLTYYSQLFSSGTWIRVSIWLVMGVFVYIFYGRTHSSLTDAVYVPAAHADKIYRSSIEYVA